MDEWDTRRRKNQQAWDKFTADRNAEAAAVRSVAVVAASARRGDRPGKAAVRCVAEAHKHGGGASNAGRGLGT